MLEICANISVTPVPEQTTKYEKIQIKLQQGRQRGKYKEKKKTLHGEYKCQKQIADEQ